MRWMLQFKMLGCRGAALARNGVRVEFRRPLLVAVATGFASLQLLPAGGLVAPVEMVGPQGAVEQTFVLAADDPQLQTLHRIAKTAHQPDYRKRSVDFYRAQWDRETAEFYLATSLKAESAVASPARPQASRSSADGVVRASFSSASFSSAPSSNAAPADGANAVPAERDWTAFWESLRDSADERLRLLEPPPRAGAVFAQLRFGEVRRSPRSTAVVFFTLCLAVVAYLAARRWTCAAPRPRIGLRAECRLEIPPRWARQRWTLGDLWSRLNRGTIVEGTAWSVMLWLATA